MPIVPGTRVGPYEIVSPLGAGGMGEVYRARDTRLQRDIAMKILPAALACDEIEGRAVDARTDIFSLGTVLYELATGERPFAGDSSACLMASILRDQPAPITQRLRVGLERLLLVAGATDGVHHARLGDRRFEVKFDWPNGRNNLAGLLT